MYTLNLPSFDIKLRKGKSGTEVFDRLRKKYIKLTPEEWVRQHFINYLITEKEYPETLMANETAIQLYSLSKRCDTVIYDNTLQPVAICEYKKPNIKIDQQVFDQVLRYNIVLKVKFLIISNGINHYCCVIDHEDLSYYFLEEIPNYKEITS